MRVSIAFDEPSRLLEAGGNSDQRRIQAARRAAAEVVAERNAVERDQVKVLVRRLSQLRRDLTAELLGGTTDFRAYDIRQRIAAVDRIVGDAVANISHSAQSGYGRMLELGEMAADEPIRGALLKVLPGLPSIDAILATVAAENTLELLTQPMQQFAADVKVALRGVALAGEGRMAAIQKLRERIAGQGMDNAQYKAERIIRTELSRVFNQSNYSRLLTLSKDFPFLRKTWRAANDNRTRLGHRQAAKSYARGQGARIGDPFIVEVHQEFPGKPAKLLGVARLRFPVDPDTEPAGRIAAAATIMCRCNAIIDFDVADFAKHSAQQIQMALGGILPKPGPTPVPAPAPLPTLPKPKATRKPKAPKPVVSQPLPIGPGPGTGAKVSSSLTVQPALKPLAQKVLRVIDAVHSDGVLKTIGISKGRGSHYGVFKSYPALRQAIGIEITAGGLKAHPLNTLAHEIGHWLDAIGLFQGKGHTVQFASQSDMYPAIVAWRDAVRGSKVFDTLTKWYRATTAEKGNGVIPMGVSRKHVGYLLSRHELFARSYAQYVAVTSGDPEMLAELRLMQRQSTVGPVARTTPYSTVPHGQVPRPGVWNYPNTWQDDDFEPIRKAFDEMFRVLGWRK